MQQHPQPSSGGLAVLLGLQNTGKHIHEGLPSLAPHEPVLPMSTRTDTVLIDALNAQAPAVSVVAPAGGRHFIDTHPDDFGQRSVPGLLAQFPEVTSPEAERVREAARRSLVPTPATRPLLIPGLRPTLRPSTFSGAAR